MIDGVSIGLIVSVAVLIIERSYSWLMNVKHSECSSCCAFDEKSDSS